VASQPIRITALIYLSNSSPSAFAPN
jgi:hypothetical protein